MAKYVILLHFYISILKKHKKHKNTILNKIKNNPIEHLHNGISNHRQTILLTYIVLWILGPTRLLVQHTFLYYTLACTTHICLLYKGTHVYSIISEIQYNHSVFLTWYQSHCSNFFVSCSLVFVGIFRSLDFFGQYTFSMPSPYCSTIIRGAQG